MNLDCIENDDDDGDEWKIVDYDNSAMTICQSDSIDGAWYMAASILSDMINNAADCLTINPGK